MVLASKPKSAGDGGARTGGEFADGGIRKASLFFGGRSEKRLGRISPPQSSVIGGRMHSEEEGEEALLTRL